jgi:hypothetical protein
MPVFFPKHRLPLEALGARHVARHVKPPATTIALLSLCALTLSPPAALAATTGHACKLVRFTPSTGKVLKQRVVTVKGSTVREPAPLATFRVPCTGREPTRSCLRRVRARARRRHPGRKLEVTLEERRGEGPRHARCVVLDARTSRHRCRPMEDDAACKQRVLRAARRRAGAGSDVTAQLTGPDGGVAAVLEVDGKRVQRTFKDWERMAAHVRALDGQGRRVVLISGVKRRDPARRRVVVTVQRTVTRRLPDTYRLRMSWRPAATGDLPRALRQLHDEAEKAGVTVVRFEPQTSGVVELELACSR